jgi:hypothetical protein
MIASALTTLQKKITHRSTGNVPVFMALVVSFLVQATWRPGWDLARALDSTELSIQCRYSSGLRCPYRILAYIATESMIGTAVGGITIGTGTASGVALADGAEVGAGTWSRIGGVPNSLDGMGSWTDLCDNLFNEDKDSFTPRLSATPYSKYSQH